MKSFTRSVVFLFLSLVVLAGCATPYSPYGVAARGSSQQVQSDDPIVATCQRELGQPPSITDQAITTVVGAGVGAALNTAIGHAFGGDLGRSAVLGAAMGGVGGGVLAAMQPAQYREALNWCVDQARQAQAEAYANRPCETSYEGTKNNNGQWETQRKFKCSDRAYSPPIQIPPPSPN